MMLPIGYALTLVARFVPSTISLMAYVMENYSWLSLGILLLCIASCVCAEIQEH